VVFNLTLILGIPSATFQQQRNYGGNTTLSGPLVGVLIWGGG